MRVIAGFCLVLGTLLTAACSDDAGAPVTQAPEAVVQDRSATERLEAGLAAISPSETSEQWARSCAFCHASGNAGAPRFGDAAAWAPRAAAGEATMLKHTLEGLGAMPPLGYCMDCTEDDFRALIRFMLPPALRDTAGNAAGRTGGGA